MIEMAMLIHKLEQLPLPFYLLYFNNNKSPLICHSARVTQTLNSKYVLFQSVVQKEES